MINIFLFSFISTLYLICAGSLFCSRKNYGLSEIYRSIFFGSFLLAFTGVLLNFFTPLNVKINTLLFILILVIGFILLVNRGFLIKILYCSFIISLIATLILSFDTIYRPDANLYHLPFTQIINENKIIFGVSNIHFRFGHISILQYLNAIFNNFLFQENGILIPAAIIFSTFVMYFYNEIKENANEDKVYTFYIFLLLAYILYGYNRYSEFGNDTIAHLYFFLVSSCFLKEIHKENIRYLDFIKLIILSLFCFILKTSLVFVFIFPLYIFIFRFNKKYILNYWSIIIFLVFITWIVKNIIISGCIIYPVEITCFDRLDWFSNNSKDLIAASAQSLDNEAWTKGWPDYKGQPVTQEKYVDNFYWLQTWIDNHGLLIFKKLSIFFTIILILIFVLKKLNTNLISEKIKSNNAIYLIFFLSLICVLIWFIRFPVFRYGSSYLVVFLVSISTIIAIKYNIFQIEITKFQKYLNICIIIFFVLFSLKHTLRIYENYFVLKNNVWPKFPKVEDTINISRPILLSEKFTYYLLKDSDGCGYTSSPCTPFKLNKNIYQKKIKGYDFYLLKK